MYHVLHRHWTPRHPPRACFFLALLIRRSRCSRIPSSPVSSSVSLSLRLLTCAPGLPPATSHLPDARSPSQHPLPSTKQPGMSPGCSLARILHALPSCPYVVAATIYTARFRLLSVSFACILARFRAFVKSLNLSSVRSNRSSVHRLVARFPFANVLLLCIVSRLLHVFLERR